MTVDFKPIKMKRTYEIVADQIKKKIFLGEYHVGDRLPSERDLAELIQVSRNAVREAYHALELSGVVEIRKGTEGGTFIKDPCHKAITQSISDLLFLRKIRLADITEARLILENGLAERAVQRITQEDLSELQELVNQAFAKIEQGVPAHEENIQFHIRLYKAAHNPLLTMVYSSVMDLFLLILEILPAEFEASRVVAQEHNQIIVYLRNGQQKQLSAFLSRHIREANNRLLVQTKKITGTKGVPLGGDASNLTKTLIEQSN